MTILLDATRAQNAMIADLAEGICAVEATIASLQAVRDGMLAVASRVALDIARCAGHPDHGDLALRSVAAEIGAAQRMSDRTVERRMGEAAWLVEDFPAVWAAQGAGAISAAHARVIVDAGAHLDDAAERAAYAARALQVAVIESPNRLRRMARRLAEQFHSRPLVDRHRDARELRRVWVRDLDDGMAELGVLAPAVLVHGMHDRLTGMARAINSESATEPRTTDQLRADLLADLLLTGSPDGHDTDNQLLGAIQARVEITVPVLTLIDTDHGATGAAFLPPAELDGRSPIDVETARKLAGATPGWERVLTHPITGTLLAVDRYRPSEDLARHLRARDQRCRFPACGLAARKCDIDHTHAASKGGATCDDNLAHLCRRHHMLKHHSPWQVTHSTGDGFASNARDISDPGGGRGGGRRSNTNTNTNKHAPGTLIWTSPTGAIYVDRPPSQNTVRFTSGISAPAPAPAPTPASAPAPAPAPASGSAPASASTLSRADADPRWPND